MKKTGEEITTNLRHFKIIQRNDFQNFTLDSILLGDFVKINRKSKKILDIGTGCGIIAMLIAEKSKAEIIGIEIQEVMSKVAKKNIENNNFSNQIKIINDDIKKYKEIFKRDEFDIIATNPPYFEFIGNKNQINDLEQLATARHNIDITLADIIKASSYLLKNSGYFNIVFRSDRLVEVLSLFTKYNLEPKRIKNIYTKHNANAKLCLLEGIKNGEKGLKIEYPIFVNDEKGNRTEYIKKLYGNDNLK